MTTKLRFSVRPQKTVEVEEEVKTWDTWARKCTRSSNSPYINQALSCPFAKVLPNKLVLRRRMPGKRRKEMRRMARRLTRKKRTRKMRRQSTLWDRRIGGGRASLAPSP